MQINPTTPHAERVRIARVAMVSKFPYLAPITFGLTLVETHDHPTMAVDKHARLYYNPAFVDTLTDSQLVGLIWHEVNHLLREHPGPRGKTMHAQGGKLAFIAADLEINDDAGEAKVDLPKDDHPYAGYFPENLGLPKGLLAEEYLQLLLKNPPPRPPQPHGSGAGGDPGSWELGAPTEETGGVEESALEVARQATAQAIRDYEAKGRGTVPSGMRRWADAYLNPKVDWRSVLRQAVKKGLADLSARKRPTYAHPHRRASATHPVLLPGHYGLKPRVAVVVDTSGSMNKDLLSQALAEVRGVLRRVKKTTVYTVDAEVHAVQKVYRPEDITLLGGGGTDMGQGILRAAKEGHDLIIVITDGLTPWPPPVATPTIACILTPDAPTPPGWIKTVRVQ